MERPTFVCPVTGKNVDGGFECEIDTLLRIRTSAVRRLCPACGKWHEWRLRDAALQAPPAAA